MAKKTSIGDGYSIGAVAKITGLTDHTIRVWERRYKAVVAKRTEGGHRVYSAANVEKLGLLKQLTDNGLSIGGIATKSNSALRKAVHHLEEVSMKAVPDKFLVAVLGERLRLQLLEDPGPLEIVVAGSDSETFTTDLAAQTVDVVILEVTILDADSLKQLKSLQSQGQA
jgi:DNA-binding transcriptional MerR regulator